jgi:hypothetical protein
MTFARSGIECYGVVSGLPKLDDALFSKGLFCLTPPPSIKV